MLRHTHRLQSYYSPITFPKTFPTGMVKASWVLGVVPLSQLPSALLPPYCFHLPVHPRLICHNFMLTYCSKTIAAAPSEECKQGSVISSPLLPSPSLGMKGHGHQEVAVACLSRGLADESPVPEIFWMSQFLLRLNAPPSKCVCVCVFMQQAPGCKRHSSYHTERGCELIHKESQLWGAPLT